MVGRLGMATGLVAADAQGVMDVRPLFITGQSEPQSSNSLLVPAEIPEAAAFVGIDIGQILLMRITDEGIIQADQGRFGFPLLKKMAAPVEMKIVGLRQQILHS